MFPRTLARTLARNLALMLGTLVTVVAPCQAASLDFTFSFQNIYGNGTVTGIVRGLTDNATVAATSVEVLANTDGFGIGEYIGTPDFNEWTVSSGIITAADFVAIGTSNAAPAVTSADLAFSVVNRAGESGKVGGALDPVAGKPVFVSTLESRVVFTPVAPVPVPAALPLFASAFVGLGLAARRRRPATATATATA